MAGEWIKFEASTIEKPEVLAITVAMGWDDPDLTVGKLLRVWRWFDQQTIDGNAPGVTSALLDRLLGVSGLCAAMESVGWLESYEGGVRLPNFDRHNGKTAKNRALTAKRVAKHKANAGTNAKGNAPTVTPALPREEKRREEVTTTTLSGRPDVASPSHLESVQAIEYLNEKTNKGYRPVDSNLRMVKARLSEGFSLEDVKAVIDRQVGKWGQDPKMAEYLRPKTLFAASNFASYAGQAASQPGGDWWHKAGFGSKFEAENAGCNRFIYHQFQNGQRMEVTE